MTRYSKARDVKLYDAMIELNMHIKICRTCYGARKVSAPRDMCDVGVGLVLKAAGMYDDMTRMRRKAHSDPRGVVWACPDPAAHGKTYAVMAIPMIAIGQQESLF